MSLYDKYYKEVNYFGNPYPELIKYMKQLPKGTLIDLGAGQGRDSVPLSRMGFLVTSVDTSLVGLEQIKLEEPKIKILHKSFNDINVKEFDYILLDSIFHFYKNDLKKETKLLMQIIESMEVGAILIDCLLKNNSAEKHFKKIVNKFKIEILKDNYIDYPDFKSTYHLYVFRKK